MGSKRWPNLYSCHLIFRFPSLCIPVAAPLEQRGSIVIRSTPRSVYPCHMKSLSHDEEPWVSTRPSGSICNCIHFVWFSDKCAKSHAPTTRGRHVILILGVPSLRRLLAVCDSRTRSSCLRWISSAGLSIDANGSAKTNTWFSSNCTPIRRWPFHRGIIYLPLLSRPVASCALPQPAAVFAHPPSPATSHSGDSLY